MKYIYSRIIDKMVIQTERQILDQVRNDLKTSNQNGEQCWEPDQAVNLKVENLVENQIIEVLDQIWVYFKLNYEKY